MDAYEEVLVIYGEMFLHFQFLIFFVFLVLGVFGYSSVSDLF